MPKNLPQPIIEQNLDDLQTVNLDIDQLIAQYITPIDKLRSISRPAAASSTPASTSGSGIPFANDFQNLQVDSVGKLESLTHAFYRSLGFPVCTESGKFYNPGFDPTGGKNLDAHTSIDQSFSSSSIQVLTGVRETNPIELLQIFANQDLTASIYTLVMRYVKPFQCMKLNGQPFDVDAQLFTVTDRDTEILLFSSFNPSLSDQILSTSSSFSSTAGFAFNSGRHILKPFVVDPRLERTTSPDSSRICVPFLPDKNSTKLNSNQFLQRPGIEYIIRQRLSDVASDKGFLAGVQQVISGASAPSPDVGSLNLDDLRSVVAALADQNKISSSVTSKLSGFTSTQAVMATQLIKSIKGCIKLLADAIKITDIVKQKINFVPVPAVSGPIAGAQGASLSRVGTSGVGEIDAAINNLRIQKINAQRIINDTTDIGSFAVPFAANTNTENVSSYQEQLEQLTRKRDSIAADGFKAMGIIEAVCGEISGLGLVDILAIYFALWTMDLADLVGFLDTDSLQRLKDNNPALLAAVPSNPSPILTTLSNFEAILINTLSFADKVFQSVVATPLAIGQNI